MQPLNVALPVRVHAHVHVRVYMLCRWYMLQLLGSV
jgi:hypothetical protein